ncbi:hypothetical protein A1507_17815 [Methylomonas koyamae]|uniref:DUF5610 domain-containing protein n=1 Tax=Methylomonas koyamae TaxID=702114 RepID=A0A177N4R3_9GAMM|nr:hypothetical protein [Methylomonas koyamae]OAI13017.1 hypothetical protein A1507_17815 [Methylomonas koyamae]
MAGINSISTSLYVSQTTINIFSTSGADKSDALNSQTVSETERFHGHRQRGAGFFAQSVVHVLEGLGLAVPRNNSGSGDKDTSNNSIDQHVSKATDLGRLLATFLQDLHQILARSGTGQTAVDSGSSGGSNAGDAGQVALTPATAAVAGSTAADPVVSSGQVQVNSTATANSPAAVVADSSASQAVAADFGEALHSFLHELRRALLQSSDRVNNEGRRSGHEHWGRAAGWHGYRNLSANLDNLIADLTSEDQANAGVYESLKEDFNRLVGLVDSSNGSSKPSLLAFLNKLKDEVASQNPVSAGAGSIVSASV